MMVDVPNDDNASMSDLRYDNISEPFSKRVKAQMKGYASEEAEKLHKMMSLEMLLLEQEEDEKKA